MAQNTAMQEAINKFDNLNPYQGFTAQEVVNILLELLPKERQDGIQLVFNGMKFMAEDLGEQESNYGIAEKIFTQTFTQNK